MKEERKPEFPETDPDDELQKTSHTKAQKMQAPTETRTRIGGRLGKQTCQPLHHASPSSSLFPSLNSVGVCLLVGCLTSQQHASVSQGRICSDNFTCCHIEIEVADQTFYLAQSQNTDSGPTSPSAHLITPGA